MLTKDEFMELSKAFYAVFRTDFPGVMIEEQEIKETLFFALEGTSIDCPISLQDIGVNEDE